ncbi:MAG: SIMPL domain-containing protein [Gammaproteobacteria bacterium]|jgi:predicted secreted protein
MRRRFVIPLLCLCCWTAAPGADTQPRYNQVRLQAQRSETVSNDTMHVTLSTYAEMKDAGRLAEKLNREMEWALAEAKEFAEVKAGTGSYQTWPVRRDNVMKGWRAQQQLLLESRDMAALSRLSGRLQEKLQIKSMNFTVSDERRAAVENRLITAALDAFRERADIVGDKLQANGYRIVDLNIGTSEHPPPIVYQARMAAAPMEAAQPVAVEGGESDIQVTVGGTIELIVP